MPQKKCVTIYGYSDDLVEIENSQYKEDEIDCYDKAIRFFFVDGTIISICYVKGGVWKITHEAIGKAWYELTRCEDDDDDAYSDVFKIDSEIISYEAFTPKAKPIQDIQEQNQEKLEKLIPEHIRLIFFDFDDTLFTHYTNQRFRDDDIIMTSLLQTEAKEQGSGYKVFDTIGKPNQLMRKFVEEETDKIPKFCISIDGTKLYLVHRPIDCKPGMLNLYGHVHRQGGIWSPYGFNICTDVNHFRLYSENDIRFLISQKAAWDNDADTKFLAGIK